MLVPEAQKSMSQGTALCGSTSCRIFGSTAPEVRFKPMLLCLARMHEAPQASSDACAECGIMAKFSQNDKQMISYPSHAHTNSS